MNTDKHQRLEARRRPLHPALIRNSRIPRHRLHAVNFALDYEPTVREPRDYREFVEDLKAYDATHKPMPLSQVRGNVDKKPVHLARVLADRNRLADLGLREKDVESLEAIALENPHVASLYLNAMFDAFSIDVVVTAHDFALSGLKFKLESRRKIKDGDLFAVSATSVIVHDNDVIAHRVASDGGIYEYIGRYWKYSDVDLLSAVTVGMDIADTLVETARAYDIGVLVSNGNHTSLDTLFIEEDDELPTRAPTARQRSVADYSRSDMTRGVRRFGGAYDYDYGDSIRLSSDSVKGFGDEYSGCTVVSGSASELIRANLITVPSCTGGFLGHSVRCSGMIMTPSHIRDESSLGLACEPDDLFGLVSDSPSKAETYSLYFIDRDCVRSTRVRVLSVHSHQRSFYFHSTRRLLPGMSGALIADDRMRAIGLVERAVDYNMGLYMAHIVHGDRVSLLDLKGPQPCDNRGSVGPIYRMEDDGEFVFVGYYGDVDLSNLAGMFVLRPRGFFSLDPTLGCPLSTSTSQHESRTPRPFLAEAFADLHVRSRGDREVFQTLSVSVESSSPLSVSTSANPPSFQPQPPPTPRSTFSSLPPVLNEPHMSSKRRADERTYGVLVPMSDDALLHVDVEPLLLWLRFQPKDDSSRLNFVKAISHRSFAGYECARSLAHVGDTAAKLVISMCAQIGGFSVADVDRHIKLTQCNEAWATLARGCGLDRFVLSGPGLTDITASVLATTVEAVIGAVFMDSGIKGILTLNSTMRWMGSCDMHIPLLLSKLDY